MSKRIAGLKVVLFGIFFVFHSFTFFGEGKSFVVDRVVAIVNDDVITMTDLQRSLVPLIKQLKGQYEGMELKRKLDEASQTVLEQLIENKLILKTATDLNQKEELKVPEKEIMKYVHKIIERFPSEEVFRETLKQENLSFEDFKKDCVEQLLVKKLVAKEVSSRVLVSNEDVRTYYDGHIKDYTSPERVSFSQIWLKKGVEDEARKQKILEIQERLNKGEDFKKLAAEFSEDPNAKEGKVWKNVERGQFTRELDEVLWKLSPGEVSRVVETSVGYHILKMEIREKPRVVPLSDVYGDIEEAIYFERAESIRKEWIERLRKDAYVQIQYEAQNP